MNEQQVKAKIIKGANNELFLFIDRVPEDIDIESYFLRHRIEDIAIGLGYSIEADEVEAVRDACEEWLEKESQEQMKKGVG